MELMITNNLTMSSLEIAKITNKQHKDVLYDIRNMLNNLDIGIADFSATYIHPQNKQSYECFNLPKRECFILISGYNIKLRALIIDRWQELEEQNKNVFFGYNVSTHKGALLALVEAIDKIEEDKPKVEYFDNLVERKLLVNLRDTAKELKLQQNSFIKWLLDNKYIYRDIRNDIKPYAKYTPRFFEIKEWQHGGRTGIQVLTTPYGREAFNLLLKNNVLKLNN